MRTIHTSNTTDLPKRTGWQAGAILAGLWALHAAAPQIPGQGYLRFPLLVVGALAVIIWRCTSREYPLRITARGGITVGLCCWLFAATLSSILNWHTEEVLLTYTVVFGAGALLFVASAGFELTERDLDIAIVGLASGTLVPMLAGLRAFTSEWGAPDLPTVVAAYRDLVRMETYEAVTFGNRGNTAAFLVIVAPVLIAFALDKRKGKALRAFCAVTLAPIALNLIILQVRAAFISLLVALVVVWIFTRGISRLPALVLALALGWAALFAYQPDAGQTMSDQILAAVTVDTVGDTSVQDRAEAIKEGWDIAKRNWLLGIGPGGALTIHPHDSAHQFHVQQAMETGILGLLGATLFSLAVWFALLRSMLRGSGDPVNRMRFALLVGPAAYLTYSAIANAALNSSSLNTWTVLVVSMLALAPEFAMERRSMPHRVVRQSSRRQAVNPSMPLIEGAQS
jgi:O-antigen ligase